MSDEKLPRAYAPDVALPGPPVTLDPDESAHLARALRLRPGARIVVFDGRGQEFLAELTSVVRQHVTVVPIERRSAAAEPAVHVTLAQALLKGHKMDQVVRDAVMLGVAAVQPLVTAHTELYSGHGPTRRVERWHRIAAASAGQCGRAVVPEIRMPSTFGAFVETGHAGAGFMLVEPANGPRAGLDHGNAGPTPAEATLLVGPEGGWSLQEIAQAERAGYRTWTLGGRTLRADAAAMVGLAGPLGRWGEL